MKFKEVITKFGAWAGGAVGATSLALAGASYLHDSGGTLSASMNGQTLENKSTKEIVVFMDSPQTSLRLSSISPTFSNSSGYSIRDFYLDYHITTNGVQFEQTDYYKLYNDGDGTCTLKFNDNVLPGSRKAEPPFKGIIIPENGGSMIITAEATYDGSSEPFSCTFNENFIVVPCDSAMTYDMWKEKCNVNYKGNTTASIFYVDNRGNIEYAENIDLARQLIAEAKQEPVQQKTAKPTPSIAPTPKPTAPAVSEAPKVVSEVASDDFRKNLTIGFKQSIDEESGVPVFNFDIMGLPGDSAIIICWMTDNSENGKCESSSMLIVGNDYCYRFNHSYGIIIRGDKNENLKEYALCTEYPSLRDSVEIEDDYITNNTTHAIVVEYKDSLSSMLMKPFEKRKLYFANNELRFYNVPTSVLTEDYMPRKFKGDYWEIAFDVLLFVLAISLVLMTIWGLIDEYRNSIDLWDFITDDGGMFTLVLIAFLLFAFYMFYDLGTCLLWF